MVRIDNEQTARAMKRIRVRISGNIETELESWFAYKRMQELNFLRRCRASPHEFGVITELQFVSQFVPEEQQINAGLKHLRSDREIPDHFDVETSPLRDQQRGQSEQKHARRGAYQRRDRIAQPLKDT